MPKKLEQILEKKLFNTGDRYYPGIPGERKFFDAHKNVVFKNMYSDAKFDPLFKGSKVKQADREAENHGYKQGNDAKAYAKADSTRPLDSAINDGTAQRVQSTAGTDAEYASYQHEGELTETDQLQELSKKTLGSYIRRASDSREKLAKSDQAIERSREKVYVDGHDSKTAGDIDNAMRDSQRKVIKKLKNRRTGVERATKKLTKEDLTEAKKLSATNIIHHDGHPKSAAFADEYHKGHKIDHCVHGDDKMFQRHMKNNNLFHTKYEEKYLNDHEGGPFNKHKQYVHRKTGDTFQVSKYANGKGYSGTDHVIHYLGKNEE